MAGRDFNQHMRSIPLAHNLPTTYEELQHLSRRDSRLHCGIGPLGPRATLLPFLEPKGNR